MKKKLFSILLVFTLMMSVILTSCGKSRSDKTENGSNTKETATTENGGGTNPTESTAEGTSTTNDLLTLEVYNVAANYQGIATGWFANFVKNKFNLELNIIAPQASGDANALYQTRSSSGKLGDIILLDNIDFIDCINAGLVKDIGGLINNYPNLMVFNEQIKLFNEQIDNANGMIYGIPTEMTNTSPDGYSQSSVLSSPMIPWDYYKELGSPEMNSLDDLLEVLENMQKAHPTNVDGDKAYAISLWSDWDGTSIENVNQMTKWYGEEVNGSILIDGKNEIRSLVEDDAAYYKMLHFFFDANQRGLVDPDSATQDWNTNLEKMKVKRTYLYWYIWSLGFYNSVDKTSVGDGYVYIPVKDMNFYQTSDSYYGSGRVWGVGSHVDEATTLRIMEFLDWYASPESVLLQNYMIKDFNYEVLEDGTYKSINDEAMINNDIVPDEYGGGPVRDGANQLNQWIVGASSINPLTNETYSRAGWKSEKEKEKSMLDSEWIAKFGVANALELMKKNNQLAIVPSVNRILESDTTDIALIRSQCGKIICDTSWKLIYASDEAAFNDGWNEMKENLIGLGWDELVQFDTNKFQPVIDVRKASMQ